MAHTLIANTGIQILSKNVSIDLNDINEKMYFYEFFDLNTYKLSLELAHFFSQNGIYVRKYDIKDFIEDGKVTKTWDEIHSLTTDITTLNGTNVFSINARTLFQGRNSVVDKFLNVWLPFPYFELDRNNHFITGPFNWSRIKLVPQSIEGNEISLKAIVAVDTTTRYDSGDDDIYNEMPLFKNQFEPSKHFAACTSDFELMHFCACGGKHKDAIKAEWIDRYVMHLVHNTYDINKVNAVHRFNYLATYIFLLRLIAKYFDLPELELYRDVNVQSITNIDLVVDMGNSKTTALLFEEGSDFNTKTRMLHLYNFTMPEKQSEETGFDMNVAFSKADFGEMGIGNTMQFVFPSFLRLGVEAKYLMFNAKNGINTREKLSSCSSPKRYLWDNAERKNEWEYVCLNENDNNEDNPIRLSGISEQLNADGSVSDGVKNGSDAKYSRRSLMTLSFLEILAQSMMQVNSHEFREEMGDIASPRRISKIIVTCPTAMSRVEQIALRKAAEEAYVLWYRFYHQNSDESYADIAKQIEVLPSVRDLRNTEERNSWTFDEATCSQFVFLCAEIAERYKANCKDYFELYGKVRNDLKDYTKKSLTIGSLDIGAGTTDLMICAYEYESNGQVSLKPVPLFWDSFYIAGDDMLKSFVKQIVIEGPFAKVNQMLVRDERQNITKLLSDFFYYDTNRLSFNDRLLRRDFNMQVSVPIALKYIETARTHRNDASYRTTFSWNDFFEDLKPSQYLLDAFENHFGLKIENEIWEFDNKQIGDIITNQFDGLLQKIAGIMSAYKCDIVLLSGRPTSLKQIEDLFLKYYPVSPNRLKVLNNYRVGRWYPFQDGDGYFTSQKSIVAVGALLGYVCSTQGGYKQMSLNLEELKRKMTPTTEVFGVLNNTTMRFANSFVTPKQSYSSVQVNDLPIRIGTSQIDSESYPIRSFYRLDFNDKVIEDYVQKKFKELTGYQLVGADLEQAKERKKSEIRTKMPLKMDIVRENYFDDKEGLMIEAVYDCQDNELSTGLFSLQIQSLSEKENFWLDDGAFNLGVGN